MAIDINDYLKQSWSTRKPGSAPSGGGGGGGTSNYNDLENLPSVNGVTLVGNKTTKDLGIRTLDSGIIKPEDYSTEEHVIGTWIDGKPLYERTFTNIENINIFPSDWTDLLTIENCERIVHCKGMLVRKSTNECGYDSEAIRFNQNGDTLRYYMTGYSAASDWRSNSLTVTVKYTKTTDQAGAVGSGVYIEYSTDERIVGTWIDGKTLYQKTYHIADDVPITDRYTILFDGIELKNVVQCTTKDTASNMANTFIPIHYNLNAIFNYMCSSEGIVFFDNGFNRAMGLDLTIQYTKIDD